MRVATLLGEEEVVITRGHLSKEIMVAPPSKVAIIDRILVSVEVS
jgi:hypothetical protein